MTVQSLETPAIKFENVTIKYGTKEIVKSINLEVKKGQTLVIMGLSGVGKSTLIKCVNGFIKPVEGKVFVNGVDVVKMNKNALHELRKKVGMVFQSPALFDSVTVFENVAFGLREHFNYSEGDLQRIVSEKLTIVDLEGSESLNPNQLSGGMQKRASLARTIATSPEIILYDEPTTGLDPIMCNVISQLIRDLQKRLGVTSIVVTHDLESAFTIADEIAMVYDKKIVQVGPSQEFRKSTNPVVKQFIEGSVTGPIKV